MSDMQRGLFGRHQPRRHCLVYHRELVGSSASDSRLTLLRHQCSQQLGVNNNRSYYLRDPTDSNERKQYLSKLCRQFSTDIIELIRQELETTGLPSTPDADLKEEVLHHTQLGQYRAKYFHGHQQHLVDIEAFLRSPQRCCRPYVLYGPSGSGKSALMGRLAQLIHQWFTPDAIVIFRALGTTTDSSGIYSTVVSITKQICAAYGLLAPLENLHTLYSTLRAFRGTIESVSTEHGYTRPLFLLLDGIDRLQPHDESLRSLWSVRTLPLNVHVVISTVPQIGRINLLGALQTLITDTVGEVSPLQESAARDIINQVATEHGRMLTTAQVDKILTEYRDNAQPLTLVVFAHRALRWSSSMTGLEVQLAHDAQQQLATDLDELENKYGANLVALMASYITCVPIGIHERELQDLLSMNPDVSAELLSMFDIPVSSTVQQVPSSVISQIRFSLNPYLDQNRAYGKMVLAWSHRDFNALVADRYQVIYPGIDEQLITDDSTSFTLMLHEYMANMYLPDSMAQTMSDTSPNLTLHPQPLLATNVMKLMRVPVHMKVQYDSLQ